MNEAKALAAGAAIAMALFCLLAWATTGGPASFDRPILLDLRDAGDTALPIGPAWAGSILRGVTTLATGAVLAPVAFAAAVVFAYRRRFRLAGFVMAAAGGGIVFGSLLKLVFMRARPEIVKHLVETSTTGFPSGHAVNSAAACVTLCVLLAGVRDPRVRIGGTSGAVAFAFLAGFSRLYFGVHWPSDVLAGWCAGCAWALLCALVLHPSLRHR